MRTLAILALAAGATPAVAADALDELPLRVQGVLAHRSVPVEAVSLYVEDLASGEVVLSHNAEHRRNPASVMKLVTTLAALDTLGPSYRWKTELWLLGERDGDRLDGDLQLKGYGDPYLVTERLWQLQRQLRGEGLRHVTGNLLLDDSWFDVGSYDPAAFDREPLRAYNVAPNALLSNYKVVRYSFTPQPSGDGVDIAVEPPLGNLTVVNRLRTRPGACRGYQRGIAIVPNDDYDRFTFDGRFPAGCKRYSMTRAALDHNAYTAGLFRALWEESGGRIDGGWENSRAPEDLEPDLVFESLPLVDIISKVNKHSNNVMARQLLYTLGAEVAGPPGTEAAGRAAIVAWLAERKLVMDAFVLDNGAGLSRDASVTATEIAALLRYGWQSRYMPEFLSSLSLSGHDGTLSRRFRDDTLEGVAHMKTGSLDHVSSIAGYLQGRSGRRYAVVVMINHEDIHRGYGDEVQEALLHWLRER